MPIAFEPYFKIALVDLSSTSTVNTGTTENKPLQPDAGYIYEVIDIYFNCASVPASSSGTHALQVSYDGVTRTTNLIEVAGAFNNTIRISEVGWTGADTEEPNVDGDQYWKKDRGSMYASNGIPLNFIYSNDTDANQTNARTLEIMVKKIKEAV